MVTCGRRGRSQGWGRDSQYMGESNKQNHIGLTSTEGWQKMDFLTYYWEQLEGSQPQREVEDARAQSHRCCVGLRLRQEWKRGTQRARRPSGVAITELVGWGVHGILGAPGIQVPRPWPFVNITTDSTQSLTSHSCVVYTRPDTTDLSPSKNYLSWVPIVHSSVYKNIHGKNTLPAGLNSCRTVIKSPQFSSVHFNRSVMSDSATPWTAARQASLSITNSWSSLKFTSTESVMPSNHLILYRSLLLLLSIFPSIRVFSNESVLCIRWPKYWCFRLSISLSSEYSRLISFRMDWFDLHVVQGALKSLLQHHISKASILRQSLSF